MYHMIHLWTHRVITLTFHFQPSDYTRNKAVAIDGAVESSQAIVPFVAGASAKPKGPNPMKCKPQPKPKTAKQSAGRASKRA
jgi:hypothetical protein